MSIISFTIPFISIHITVTACLYRYVILVDTYRRTLGSEMKSYCFKVEIHQWSAQISNPFSWTFLRILLFKAKPKKLLRWWTPNNSLNFDTLFSTAISFRTTPEFLSNNPIRFDRLINTILINNFCCTSWSRLRRSLQCGLDSACNKQHCK